MVSTTMGAAVNETVLRPPAEAAGFHALPSTWFAGSLGREQPPEDPSPTVLRELRDARLPAGLCCPRCRSGRIQRWGTFAGRQRYRCCDCGRTASDLTGTPLAYSKRPELWSEFAGCLLESLSVRAAARRLGIDKDTAWRWRHALLDAHAALPHTGLSGIVETCEQSLPLCRKGERGRPDGPWRRRRRRTRGSPDPNRVWILFGRDRRRVSDAVVSPGRRPGRSDVAELLRSRPRGVKLLLHRYGQFGACGRFAIPRGLDLWRVPTAGFPPRDGTLLHLQNVLAYQRRLRLWLRRFRGVATTYLPNYLHWYAILDGLARPASRLLLEACRGPAPRAQRKRAPRAVMAAPSKPNSSRGQATRAPEGTPRSDPPPSPPPPPPPSPPRAGRPRGAVNRAAAAIPGDSRPRDPARPRAPRDRARR